MKRYPDAFFDDDNDTPRSGRKFDQKLKPYLVYDILMRKTDEGHCISADAIADELKSSYRIFAERRSIYKDIEEINKMWLMQNNGIKIDEAAAELESNPGDEDIRLVMYNQSRKGFYVRSDARPYQTNDIRLLAECVYSTRFISAKQADRLVGELCGLISTYQAETIKHNAYMPERASTDNTNILQNIEAISRAMSRTLDGKAHTPEKIQFKYLTYSIDDVRKHVERRGGQYYTVNPFYYVINGGNYYLLAVNEGQSTIKTYRIDRMKDVRLAGKPREGEELVYNTDVQSYAQKHITMRSGQESQVTVRFTNDLLDTAIDQFGYKNTSYEKDDEKHFRMKTTVNVGDHFFGWLLQFGTRVKLLEPDSIVEQFKDYMDKLRSMYR